MTKTDSIPAKKLRSRVSPGRAVHGDGRFTLPKIRTVCKVRLDGVESLELDLGTT